MYRINLAICHFITCKCFCSCTPLTCTYCHMYFAFFTFYNTLCPFLFFLSCWYTTPPFVINIRNTVEENSNDAGMCSPLPKSLGDTCRMLGCILYKIFRCYSTEPLKHNCRDEHREPICITH